MALRSEKAACALLIFAAAAGAAEFRFDARHPHLRKDGAGALVFDERGIEFTERAAKLNKHPHAWRWSYAEIQQLKLAPRTLDVLTYQDNRWKLGVDRSYHFQLAAEGSFQPVFEFLKTRLDQRFVAVVAEEDIQPFWELPVKHRLRFGGSHGQLAFGRDAVVYSAGKRGESRTWRWEDIENISSTGPFDLTITTYERARTHYGDRKGFNFQLKRPLDETSYNRAWQRVNQVHTFQLLNSYREKDRTE